MNAREHLAAVVAAAIQHPGTKATADILHAAANFLQVPVDTTGYQRRFCMRLVECAHAMGHDTTKQKGRKLLSFYIENMRGACMALEMLGTDENRHPQLNGMLIIFTMLCTRGAEVVHNLAEGKPLA